MWFKFQVLKNGEEVKLQRNALSVIEAPTGHEEEDENDCENRFWSSSDLGGYTNLLNFISWSPN